MTKKTEKEVLITLDFSGTEKKFADINELREFLQSQQNDWAWVEQAAREDGNLAQVWNPFDSYFKRVDRFISEHEAYSGQREILTDIIDILRSQNHELVEHGFILAEDPRAHFLSMLKDKESPQVACYALALLNNISVDINTPAAYKGSYWAMQYLLDSIGDPAETLQKAFDSIVKEQITSQTRVIENQMAEQASVIENRIAQQKDTIEIQVAHQASVIKNKMAHQASALVTRITDQTSVFENKMAEQASVIENRIAQQKDTIEIQIAHQASVIENKVAHQASALVTRITDQASAFENRTAKQESDFELILNEAKKRLTDFENQKATQENVFERRIDKQASDSEKQIAKQAEDFEITLNEAKGKLTDFETTFKENIALQSSVAYWTKKREHHQKVMWWMAIFTVTSAVVTGLVTIQAANEYLNITIDEVKLAQIGVMLAISTLGVWLTRLSAKIFISNLHLRTDADERVTMIQTYLAFLAEGKGPKDDERQLILQTLFRPSTTGFIKDDGPATPFGTIVTKATSKKG